MRRLLGSGFFIHRQAVAYAFLTLITPLLARATDLGPPVGSWERWMLAIESGGKGGLPGRPDGKSPDAELPVWVDCHLSWYFDRPATEKSKLSRQLVLRSDSKLCKGQLEQWAR